MEAARIQSLWEDAQNIAEEMYPTSVGSGETTPLVAAHTAGYTWQSTLRTFSVTSPLSAFGYSKLTAGGDPIQREAQSEFRRVGELPSVLSARREPCVK